MGGERRVSRRRDFSDCQCLGFAYLGGVEASLDDLHTLGWMAVGSHFADAQMIVREDAIAAFFLNSVMLPLGPPAHDGFLVPPRGERQHPSFTELALESLVVDE